VDSGLARGRRRGTRGRSQEPGDRKKGIRSQEVEQGVRGPRTEQGVRNLDQDKSPTTLKLLRRRQKVILNGQASETASIIQGSCLGPTLAKCFSNTSHKGRNLLPEDKPLVSKFADDEKRCRVVNNEEQGERM
jgi:hypothetical protein